MMMNKMDKINAKVRGRPTLLTNDLKRYIDSYKQAHPHWSARNILDDIYRKFFIAYRENFPKWTDDKIEAYLKSKLPGVNSVQRYIREITGHQSPLEQPWHLGLISIRKYQVSADSVPDILSVQEWCEKEHPDVVFFRKGEPLTIRQALWIARLHGITKIMRAGIAKRKLKNFDVWYWLWEWSRAYAQCERLSLTTAKLDKAIWSGGAMPITARNAIRLHYSDRHIEDIFFKDVAEIEKDGAK